MSMAAPYTYLFVPGNRPERFAKAAASEAERVILDLEDAVAPADKAAARQAIHTWMHTAATTLPPQRLMVRINDARSDFFADDLALLRTLPACGVMLAKAERAEDLQTVRNAMQPETELLALVETAAGIAACPSIASHASVTRLALGALDLMVDLNIPADSPTLTLAASQLVLASRAAGIAAPVAGVTPSVLAEHTQADMQDAMRLGFGAKMCIHPAQLAGVRRALAPLPAEVDWAREVVTAWDAAHAGNGPTGALQVQGKMVDKPVYLRAQRILNLQQFSQAAA
ncbi:CitE Citrate lyase beta subunit [Comamonadaceae bacterium]